MPCRTEETNDSVERVAKRRAAHVGIKSAIHEAMR